VSGNPVIPGDADRAQLERWVHAQTSPQRLVRRSRIALMVLAGLSSDNIAARVGVSTPTVRLWKRRFEQGGPMALSHDAPGRGRHPAIEPEAIEARLREANLLTADGRPISLRRASALLGISTASVWRAWQKLAAGVPKHA
jgi:transposase